MKKFSELRERLNIFFMHFVSEIMFLGEPPSLDVIRKILNYVTSDNGNREFSIFKSEQVVDANPVLISFLLKLLLQSKQSGAAITYLNTSLSTWQDSNRESYLLLATLIVDCQKV